MKSDILGIIGGGQLGMFMCIAAKKIGAKTIVFSTEKNFSAKSFCDRYILGSFDDKTKLDEFINSADVFTIETENISKALLKKVEKRKKLYPSSKIVEIAQNRLKEKKFLNNINKIKTTNFLEINSFKELKIAVPKFEYNCILKTQEMGYDGKGQFMVNETNIQEFKDLNLSNFILEETVDFKSEISVIVIRNKDETVVYPPVENIHKNSILRETIYPAKIDKEIKKKSIKIAREIANALELNGILAVEMFLTKDNKILINELAPRPHNSGHWTMDSCKFSQFDNLISLITKGKIYSPEPSKNCKMINIIGDDYSNINVIKKSFKCYDYYKKEIRPSRKMGHYMDFG